MIDVHTIGAGGGSIAYRDAGGAFRVGPRSAGAVPGPAAYGLGGAEPTVTDANLVLGRLDPEDFLGGGMQLDLGAAQRVVQELADRLGLAITETAEGILTILNSNMANAIRSRTVQKGIDPRGFVLVAFGGAGPLHGAEVAGLLGIPEVLVPPYPGITSAMGLLTTDLKYDVTRTQFQTSGTVDLDKLNADLAAMQSELAGHFAADGVAPEQVSYARAGDLRYVGQGYELKVALPDGILSRAELDSVWQEFHRKHQAEYGRSFSDTPIEIVNVRVSGTGRISKIQSIEPPHGETLDAARSETRPCLFRTGGKLQSFETPFYRRILLPIGARFAGPAIVLQSDSTTVVPPGWGASVDRSGNLVLRAGETA